MNDIFLKLAAATAVIASAFLLSGCATGVKYQEMANSMPSLQQDQGRIYFFRSSSMMGAALQPEIRLNGEIIGRSKPGGFFYVDRPAGNYVASTATETEKSASFALQPGETKYLRTSVSFGLVVGRVLVELETPDKARPELSSLSYTGTVPAKQASK